MEDVLDNIIAELFGKTLQNQKCSKCFDNGQHYTSLSITNCPKHLFVRSQLVGTTVQNAFILTPHVNISKIISKNIIYTRSYSIYTLRSFITFYEKKKERQYITYARKKQD